MDWQLSSVNFKPYNKCKIQSESNWTEKCIFNVSFKSRKCPRKCIVHNRSKIINLHYWDRIVKSKIRNVSYHLIQQMYVVCPEIVHLRIPKQPFGFRVDLLLEFYLSLQIVHVKAWIMEFFFGRNP